MEWQDGETVITHLQNRVATVRKDNQMNCRNMFCVLVVMLLTTAVIPANLMAQTRVGKIPAGGITSVLQGDPPPGDSMALSISRARAQLKEAIKNKYAGTAKSCRLAEGFQGLIGNKLCNGTVVFGEAIDIRIGLTGFHFTSSYTERVDAYSDKRYDVQTSVSFKEGTKYMQAYSLDPTFSNGVYELEIPKRLYGVGTPEPWPSNYPVLVWGNKTSAEKFADAFNRLLYAARQDEEFAVFSAAAKNWRENPVKPSLPDNLQRYRVMAEDAFMNKDFEKALDYYEKGLAIEPLWPQGQFNAALLYGEIKDYGAALLHMRCYLELVPNAKNAKAAREKMYLWEGKAKEASTQ
jgi:tetratricopeptide (TPR) repeat protein